MDFFPPSERRSAPRFQLTLPLVIRWGVAASEVQLGYCRNVCANGMLVFALHSLQPGSSAEVEVIFPEYGKNEAKRSVRVLLHGIVVRVERCSPESLMHVFAVVGQVKELALTA